MTKTALEANKNIQISTGLAKIRSRRIWAIVVALGGAAMVVLIGSLLDALDYNAPFVAPSLIAAWLVAAGYSAVRYAWSRCPRCSLPFFFRSWLYGNAFSRKCQHCQLPLRG